MLTIKSHKKLRSADQKGKFYSKLCFVGFRETQVWGKTDIATELSQYENWLKEL